jgi:hypothetical protein
MWGNSDWDILINENTQSPFFTSDFPAAIEPSSAAPILNRVVPLAPDIAIRIKPDVNINHDSADFSFPFFRHKVIRLSVDNVRRINTAIARCAEDFVFYRDQHEWVLPFLKKHSGFRVEMQTEQIRVGKGTYLPFRMRIQPT